jgi:branched-chain amino acid transport system ATP-binding protein
MTPRLEVEGLTKRFGGLVAVDRMSFSIGPAESVALIGPNGAGKTTVFSLVAGEIEADAGSVRLDGREIGGTPAFRRSRWGIARTYQRLEVFPEMTVLEHLLVAQSAHRGQIGVLRDLLGRGRPTAEELGRAEAVLEEVGLEHQRDVVVGTMSLGQCRLVELARAIATQPTVLLADEPSSGLDSIESRDIVDVLLDLRRRGLSLALVEHDLDVVAAAAERVVVLDLGCVIAEGTFEEVMALEAVRRAYLGDTA